jgi:transglutaminase-like putative cysteine protease
MKPKTTREVDRNSDGKGAEDRTDRGSPIGRIIHSRPFIPILGFGIAVALFAFSSQFVERPPVLNELAPEVALPGDVLVLTGENFGDSRSGGEVVIAGARTTTSSYLEWSDTQISVIIPEDAGSGLVKVVTKSGVSNGLLFTNRRHIPIVLSGPGEPGQPYIRAIEPQKGTVGSLVSIQGINFNFERGQGKVLFTPPLLARGSQDESTSHLVEATDLDGCYEIWSDQEIHVRIPDGASSGNVWVSTDHGISNSVYFEVIEEAGTKVFLERRGYQIGYSVDVTVVSAETPNSLDLWIPSLFAGLTQRNIESVHEPEPLWQNFRGVMRYRFEDVYSGQRITMQQTSWFDRVAVECRINSTGVSGTSDTGSKLYTTFTHPDPIVPSDDPAVIDRAARIVRRADNPYINARSIYRHMLDVFTLDTEFRGDPVEDGLSGSTGDPYAYSILFTALCRTSGIPARPVSGYLVYGNKNIDVHHWAEFYIDGFGWVPVDPSLGDGLRFGEFPSVEDPAEYYFGNMDNQHITFTRGYVQIPTINPRGRRTARDRAFSLQGTFEESNGGLNVYIADWRDAEVVDWW